MRLPEIETYGNGTNGRAILLHGPGGTLKLWFSYATCVAFALNGRRTVCENVWSNTTGRHLAAIDGGTKDAKRERIASESFPALLEAALSACGANAKREALASFGAECLGALEERGAAREDSRAGLSRSADGCARDGFYMLGQRARQLGLASGTDAQASEVLS